MQKANSGKRKTLCECRRQSISKKKYGIETKGDDFICNRCRHNFYADKKPKENPYETQTAKGEGDDYVPPHPQPRSTVISSPPSVSLKIPSTSKSHNYCFICKRPGPKLIVVTSDTRLQTFVQHNILVPAGCRCCPNHINNEQFIEEAIVNLPTTETAFVNRSMVINLLNKMREIITTQQKAKFDFESMLFLYDSDCINITGLNKSNFNELSNCIKPYIRNTPARSYKMALGLFLLKLKSGISNKLLSTLFSISRSSVKRAVASVRKTLMNYFVPFHLGLNHITRQDVITTHTRPLAQYLFGDGHTAILVLDGTYIYIQKSNNFQFQRRSYSMHKERPLVKPMIITTTTGYFVTVVGPYLADSKNNDSSILNHILRTNIECIRSWIAEDDVFIVDRGFRDSLGMLEELGIKAQMPSFMTKGEKQMQTEDANASRLVTKVS